MSKPGWVCLQALQDVCLHVSPQRQRRGPPVEQKIEWGHPIFCPPQGMVHMRLARGSSQSREKDPFAPVFGPGAFASAWILSSQSLVRDLRRIRNRPTKLEWVPPLAPRSEAFQVQYVDRVLEARMPKGPCQVVK